MKKLCNTQAEMKKLLLIKKYVNDLSTLNLGCVSTGSPKSATDFLMIFLIIFFLHANKIIDYQVHQNLQYSQSFLLCYII